MLRSRRPTWRLSSGGLTVKRTEITERRAMMPGSHRPCCLATSGLVLALAWPAVLHMNSFPGTGLGSVPTPELVQSRVVNWNAEVNKGSAHQQAVSKLWRTQPATCSQRAQPQCGLCFLVLPCAWTALSSWWCGCKLPAFLVQKALAAGFVLALAESLYLVTGSQARSGGVVSIVPEPARVVCPVRQTKQAHQARPWNAALFARQHQHQRQQRRVRVLRRPNTR